MTSLRVHSPYYIWLGRSRGCDVSRFCHAFEVEGGNQIGNCSPAAPFGGVKEPAEPIPPLEIGSPAMDDEPVRADAVINITPPLSSFHYQLGKVSERSSWWCAGPG